MGIFHSEHNDILVYFYFILRIIVPSAPAHGAVSQIALASLVHQVHSDKSLESNAEPGRGVCKKVRNTEEAQRKWEESPFLVCVHVLLLTLGTIHRKVRPLNLSFRVNTFFHSSIWITQGKCLVLRSSCLWSVGQGDSHGWAGKQKQKQNTICASLKAMRVTFAVN